MDIIGVDCATKLEKTGLVRARWEDPVARILDAEPGGNDMDDRLVEWIAAADRVLLALDAPLGWPREMGPSVSEHRAGRPVSCKPDALFSRETDRLVQETIGVRPFEVGANLIARTAHSALALLGRLRRRARKPIPLAWSPGTIKETATIEVYPAATLKAHGVQYRGYKQSDQEEIREKILRKLRPRLDPGDNMTNILAKPDVLDAAICAVAAGDFLMGSSMTPGNPDVAREEGWIWVRRREERR